MSLLSDAMDNCIVIDKVKAPDGYGGGIDTFKEGMEFKAAIVFDQKKGFCLTFQKEGYAVL